jgi:hypothetical protein
MAISVTCKCNREVAIIIVMAIPVCERTKRDIYNRILHTLAFHVLLIEEHSRISGIVL